MIRRWTPEDGIPKSVSTDYHTVKAWFQQCRDLAIQIEAQQQKIARIRDLSEKCTQGLSGMPMGGGNGDKVGFAVAELDTEERRFNQMETELHNLQIEATRRAYWGVSDKATILQGDCIRMFYIENKRQPEIVDALNLCENSEVSKLIRRGCERLAKRWDSFSDFLISK